MPKRSRKLIPWISFRAIDKAVLRAGWLGWNGREQAWVIGERRVMRGVPTGATSVDIRKKLSSLMNNINILS
jgi:hypothetical protein